MKLIILFVLISRIHASIYYVSSNPSNSYRCPQNESNCAIYCNVEDHRHINIYDCNNAINCHFTCDEQLCGANSIIHAQHATNLYITQGPNGRQCLQYAAITTPNYGNAYFYTQAKRGFNKMNVYAGLHTNEIIIDISNIIDDHRNSTCKHMNVYAATAKYVSITIGSGIEWQASTLKCPIHSVYSGPNTAPCIIHTANGSLSNITIIAPDGLPNNVQIDNCLSCTNVQIVCYDSTEIYPLNTDNDCWFDPNSRAETTLEPTFEPTHNPSQTPTMEPTFIINIFATYSHTTNVIHTESQSPYWGNKGDWMLFAILCVVIWVLICICWFVCNRRGLNINVSNFRKSSVQQHEHQNIRRNSSDDEEKEQSTRNTTNASDRIMTDTSVVQMRLIKLHEKDDSVLDLIATEADGQETISTNCTPILNQGEENRVSVFKVVEIGGEIIPDEKADEIAQYRMTQRESGRKSLRVYSV